MSAQFSKGDRVRKTTVEHTVMSQGLTDHGEEFAKKGAVGTVADVEAPTLMWVEWDEGTPSRINAEHLEKVEPEFVVGQQVKDGDYDRLPVGAKAGTLEKTGEHEWRDLSGRPLFQEPHATRTLTHLPDAAEPEDKDDLYVEPEPLKEGDWVQVWAQVKTARPDEHGEFEVCLHFQDGARTAGIFVRPDAIVRTDAGQVPPWVKPAQCSSLLMVDKTTNLRQCVRPEDGHDEHVAYGVVWTDAEAYGRVEVSS